MLTLTLIARSEADPDEQLTDVVCLLRDLISDLEDTREQLDSLSATNGVTKAGLTFQLHGDTGEVQARISRII